mgnify:FL=1
MGRALLIWSSVCVALTVSTAHAYVGLDPAYTGVEYDSYLKAPADLIEDQGLSFFASLGLSATYDDNIYREEFDEQNAMIYKVLPALEGRGERGSTKYNFGYKGNYGKYSGGPADDLDDYTNHIGYAGIYHKGSRTNSSLYGDYTRGSTPRGQNNFEEKDVWNQGSIIGKVDFGARDSRFRLRLTGQAKKREYDINQANDLNNTGVGAVLGMGIAPKTRLVLDGGYVRFEYPNNNRDADRNYLRAGVSWEATAKTTGFISYGKEKYKPDNPGQPVDSDEEGTAQGFVTESDTDTWKGVLTWLPRKRDSFTLDTSRATKEGFGVGTNRVATRSSINWGHTWSESTSSNVSYRFGNDDYIGSLREDDIGSLFVGFGYRFRRNHIFRGFWNYETRDSNIPLESYDVNRFTLLYGCTYP